MAIRTLQREHFICFFLFRGILFLVFSTGSMRLVVVTSCLDTTILDEKLALTVSGFPKLYNLTNCNYQNLNKKTEMNVTLGHINARWWQKKKEPEKQKKPYIFVSTFCAERCSLQSHTSLCPACAARMSQILKFLLN